MIDRTDGLSSAAAIKGPCHVATTTNISLYGLQTIDGVSVVSGDRVLVKDQTAAYENGIYICDTGQWRRSKDFNRTKDVVEGTQVLVTDGTVNASTLWCVTSPDPIAVGANDIAFEQTIANAINQILLAAAPVESRAYAIASLHPVAAPTFLLTAGYSAPGDGGGALYKKVTSQPSHAGKLSITLTNGSTVWYEYADPDANVKAFGAKGNGSNDDTVFIQAAIDFIGAKGGGRVILPPGDYFHTAEITVANHYTTIEGEGFLGAKLTRSHAAGNSLHFTRGGGANTIFYCGVKNIRLSSTVAMSTGSLLKFSCAQFVKVEDLKIDNGWVGLHLVSCGNFNLENVNITTGSLYPTGGGEAFAYCYMDCDAAAAIPRNSGGWVENCDWRSRDDDNGHVQYGCYIASADGIWFETDHIGNANSANVYINPKTTSTQLTGLDFHNCWLDQGGTGAGLIAEGGSTVGYGYFSIVGGKVLGGGTVAQGLRFAATSGVIRQIMVTGVLIANLKSSGIQFSNCEDFAVKDCKIRSVCTVNAGHGIYVISGCKNYSLQNNESGFMTDVTTISSAGYGILATGTGYTICGNDLRGNTTGALSYSGTPNLVSDNIGHSPLTTSKAWDPGTIVNGGQEITGISIPGAEFGDFVDVSFSATTSGMRAWGYVNGAGTVAAVLTNNSGVSVDLSAGTVFVKVTKRTQ